VANQDLDDLLAVLHVEQLDTYIFRGLTLPSSNPRIYGGQALAQAMNAATRTVDSARRVHSLHAYFLRPGDPSRPILYDVDPIRDGRRFSTRRVVGWQGGRAMFSTSISFQIPEQGLDHQDSMPDVPPPESLEGEFAYRSRMAQEHPESFRVPRRAPVDYRPVEPINRHRPAKRPPVFGVWMRTNGTIGDEPGMHYALAAYMSDNYLMSTALLPHGYAYDSAELQTASIDHGLWFYGDFRADEWLYYELRSPRASGGRGFNMGSIYTRDGRLVATAVQEGLMRFRGGDD
jgi:acyl-CoA thioesterase-2